MGHVLNICSNIHFYGFLLEGTHKHTHTPTVLLDTLVCSNLRFYPPLKMKVLLRSRDAALLRSLSRTSLICYLHMEAAPPPPGPLSSCFSFSSSSSLFSTMVQLALGYASRAIFSFLQLRRWVKLAVGFTATGQEPTWKHPRILSTGGDG